MNTWAILPVKSLSQSKTRLAHLLSPAERARLMQNLLEHTIDTLHQVSEVSKTLVVSHDDTVLEIAERYQTDTLIETAPFQLKTAVTQATKYAKLHHVDSILIIPADLPFLQAHEIQQLLENRSPQTACIICPDETETGTNALFMPPHTDFIFQYGPNSFQKHLNEAKRLHMTTQIVSYPGICFDLDTETDWHIYQQTLGVNL
ncbi:MAG: 2-phospho-L-lactate guanylyltransferase [Chloroflexi bacterium]|nr:MAG: 2-phospho-L-lactate guanylyltransferase [Chloroflexota bacterium]PIE80492.1 MAG: 2-phospho-L-lactate guanylyltransferase [Chloroflexota bacterium]